MTTSCTPLVPVTIQLCCLCSNRARNIRIVGTLSKPISYRLMLKLRLKYGSIPQISVLQSIHKYVTLWFSFLWLVYNVCYHHWGKYSSNKVTVLPWYSVESIDRALILPSDLITGPFPVSRTINGPCMTCCRVTSLVGDITWTSRLITGTQVTSRLGDLLFRGDAIQDLSHRKDLWRDIGSHTTAIQFTWTLSNRSNFGTRVRNPTDTPLKLKNWMPSWEDEGQLKNRIIAGKTIFTRLKWNILNKITIICNRICVVPLAETHQWIWSSPIIFRR